MEERMLAKMLARQESDHVFLGHHVVQYYTLLLKTLHLATRVVAWSWNCKDDIGSQHNSKTDKPG